MNLKLHFMPLLILLIFNVYARLNVYNLRSFLKGGFDPPDLLLNNLLMEPKPKIKNSYVSWKDRNTYSNRKGLLEVIFLFKRNINSRTESTFQYN